MKKNIFYGIMMVAAGILSATSCTDFSDYNDVKQDATPSANQTLWENISSDSELTHFASLVKKAGYDKILNSANNYTVWAPVDSKLDLSQYENLDSAQLVLQFVKNHVANYSYVVSGTWDEPKRVNMQNNKSYNFVNNSICSFDDINVLAKNVASSNGVMHKIDGVAKYYPNLSAFINDTAKANVLGIDSLSAYYRKYNVSYLDEANSVIGPIVDGKQTYIDSVMVNYNLLDSKFRAFAAGEDSSYTMLIPTNEVWKSELAKGLAYYNFNAKIPYRAEVNNNIADQFYTVNNIEYLKDSLVKENIYRSLLFSNTDIYNRWLVGDKTVPTDTLRSVGYRASGYKYSNPQEMLSHASYEEELSNGQVKVINAFAAHPWEVYSREMTIDAYDNMLKVRNGTGKRTTFTDHGRNNTSVTYRFLHVEPTGTTSPELEVLLPNVKSDTYNVYCVFIPTVSVSGSDERPNQYKISMYYARNNATSSSQWRFSADGVENPSTDSKQASYIIDNVKANHLDENGMLLPDTVLVGKMTFPVSYAGTGVGPSIYIKVPFMTSAVRDQYNREIRLQSVILRPAAKDEYEATKED